MKKLYKNTCPTLVFILLTIFMMGCGDIYVDTDSPNIYIREGGSKYGDVLYNIDGKYIREGFFTTGKALYYIDKRK